MRLEDLLEVYHGTETKILRFGGRSKSENPALLDCMITANMESSWDERDEKFIEDFVDAWVKVMRADRFDLDEA